MTDGNARFRHQLRQPLGGFLDVFHVIIEVVNLAAAQYLTQDRLADHQRVIFADEGFDRQTAGGRSGNDRQIAHTAHRHIQRTRNRRGGQGQDIDVGAHRLDALFMAHAEAVLFINNQQAEIAQLNVRLQQFMGADKNIDFPFRDLLEDLRLLFGATKAREHLDAHRPVGEAIAKVIEVLLGEQGGRHQHRHLRFAEADIAAHQTVHRQRLTHIA